MDQSPLQWMLTPFRRALDFHGRSRRAEYWWFTLLSMVLAIAAFAIDAWRAAGNPLAAINGPAFIAMCIVILLPHLALSVRRLHDINLSGWYYLAVLLPWIGTLMLLWWMSRPGTAGDNRFGPDPLPPPENPTLYF
jgi:uncharacterized membrane protein YhaH (DUF805 family)